MKVDFRWWTKLQLRIRSLFFRQQVDQELDAELHNHLALQIEAYRAAGLSEDEAQRKANVAMEGMNLVKERCRDMRGLNVLEDFCADVRYAWRSFRHNPSFAIAAIGIAGLGIGSATAMFSAVDRLLFKGMPYDAAGNLISLGFTLPFMDREFVFSNSYFDWQHQQASFDGMGSWAGVAGCDMTEGTPVRLNCGLVDANLLSVLGVRLELGRNFTLDEDRPDGARAALISDALWRGRFGSDPGINGKLISVDGNKTRVVGVLPRDFELPNLGDADLLLPEGLSPSTQGPGAPLKVIGRLKPGITPEQARLQLQPLAKQVMESAPPRLRSQIHFVLRPLSDYQMGGARSASLLFGSVLFIMLMASSNVANLLLARSIARRREIAVRTALGAGRDRLIRQVLTESLLLSSFGGVLGCGVAQSLLFLFKHLAPSAIPRLAQASLNGRVLVFAMGLVLVNGLLFGLAPALMSIAPETLAGRSVRMSEKGTLGQFLTSSQVALSLVLLMLSAVFLQSLWRLAHVSLGIDPEDVVTAQMALESSRYSKTSGQDKFLTDLETRIRSRPGVTAVAFSDSVPPGGFVHTRPMAALQVAGHPISDRATGQVVAWRSITPQYFKALGIPILRGRTFEAKDSFSKGLQIVLNQTLARQLFGVAEAIGQTIYLSPQERPANVIGIAADVKNKGLAYRADPEYYLVRKLNREDEESQISILARVQNFSSGTVTLIVRSRLSPGVITAWVRSEIERLDPTLPVHVTTLQNRLAELSERPRFEAALLSFFGLTGLFLSAAGIYGLISFFVAQRIPEIGVRMALGASPHSILTLVLKHSLKGLGGGIAVGLVFTVWATHAVKSLLFATSALNPVLLFGAAGLLVLAGIGAALFPSRRASAIDPLVALRHD